MSDDIIREPDERTVDVDGPAERSDPSTNGERKEPPAMVGDTQAGSVLGARADTRGDRFRRLNQWRDAIRRRRRPDFGIPAEKEAEWLEGYFRGLGAGWRIALVAVLLGVMVGFVLRGVALRLRDE